MGFVTTQWRQSAVRENLGDRAVPITSTPISQMLVRSPRPDHFLDPEQQAMRNRLRPIVRDVAVDGDEVTSMATMHRAKDGGPLRTFNGGLPHENGVMYVKKAKRLLHWQGAAQRALVIRCESDFAVERVFTENVGLEFMFEGELVRYTADVEIVGADGSINVVEVKRDERDLADPTLRYKLAAAAEILRRCDIGFGVIFRDDIFRSRIHRANAELFASRALTSVGRVHLERLEGHALSRGAQSTYGALAEALDPDSPQRGRALVQAMTVRRRVEIDITRHLTADTPLTIH